MVKFIFQIILEFVLFCLLFFNVFVLKKLDYTYTLLSISGFLILLLTTVKYRRPIKQKCKDVNYIIIGLSIITLGIMYLIGLFTGFSNTSSIISQNSIGLKKWFLIFAIVGIEEIIRYFISLSTEKHEVKRSFIIKSIMLLNFILIDMTIASKIYTFNNYHQICEFFCLFLVQSISKNLFMNYVSEKAGYESCLWYRLLMDLYIFIIPVKPHINNFIEAVIFLAFPYILYMIINDLTEKKKIKIARDAKGVKVVNIAEGIIVALVVMLVSCEFKYSMIAIGSGSMSGVINKGDAVIYERYNKKDKIKKGQIIVFKKNNMKIVHRVVKIFPTATGEVYQTKGDANKDKDDWIVSEEDIIGKVNMRVMWIAWPSVLLNEIFR